MMYGLSVRNEQGVEVFSSADRLPRYIGTTAQTNVSGSFTIPVSSGNLPWVLVNFHSSPVPLLVYPTITITGNTVAWSYSGSGTAAILSITYGEY